MGIADWFSFKSKEEREREARQYAQWAFPYGEPQREKLSEIIRQLLPEEDVKAGLAVFLMGREGYRGSVKEDAQEVAQKGEEKRILRSVYRMQPMLPTKKKKALLSRYMALIIADCQVGEDLDYPTVEQLRKMAQELEPALKNIVL